MSQKSRILVVDDDKDILELLKYNLEREGYKVKTIDDSSRTLNAATKFCPDLIILDVMMPEVNGVEICERLRNLPMFEETYIFFLTAKNVYEETAFKRGGDEYVQKLMGIRSLMHKINSVLKENFVIQKRVSEIHIGDFHISRYAHAVTIKDKEIALNTSEFELLFFFAQNRGKSISRDTIVKTVSGTDAHFAANSIDSYINNLKRKIAPDVIKTSKHNEFRFGF